MADKLIDDILKRSKIEDTAQNRTILTNIIPAIGFDKLTPKEVAELVQLTDRFRLALQYSFTQERIIQKKLFVQAKNYYMNASDLHIDEILNGIFTKAENQTDAQGNQVSVNSNTPKEQSVALYEIIGFTRDVVDELALMYSPEPPVRVFLKNVSDKVKDDEDNNLMLYYKLIGNDKYQRLNSLVKALDVILIRTAWRSDEDNAKKKRIWLDLKTPDQFDVVTRKDDDSVAEAIFFETRSYDTIEFSKQDHTIYEFWHPLFVIFYRSGFVFKKDQSSEVLPNMISPVKVIKNPYGILPFTKITNNEIFTDYFSDENARRFVNNENQLTIKKLSANVLNLNSGFAQPTFKTFRDPKVDNFRLGPNNVLILAKGNTSESDDEFAYVSGNAQIEPINKDFETSYKGAADRMGVGSQSGESSSSASGVSLFISDDKKNKLINKDRERYADMESRLFENIKTVANHELANPEAGITSDLEKIDPEVHLKADFAEVVTKLSNNEQLERDQFDLDQDLADRFAIIKRRNPSWTDDQIDSFLETLDARKAKEDANNVIPPVPEEVIIDQD